MATQTDVKIQVKQLSFLGESLISLDIKSQLSLTRKQYIVMKVRKINFHDFILDAGRPQLLQRN